MLFLVFYFFVNFTLKFVMFLWYISRHIVNFLQFSYNSINTCNSCLVDEIDLVLLLFLVNFDSIKPISYLHTHFSSVLK